jgi:hypothetical protein
MPRKSPAQKLEEQLKLEKFLNLICTGMTEQAAARQVELSYMTARRMKASALQEVFRRTAGAVEQILAQEMLTLNMLQRAMMPAALHGHVRSGEVVLSIMAQRAKYLGLNSPEKIKVEISKVDEALAEIVQIIDGEVDPVRPLARVLPRTG